MTSFVGCVSIISILRLAPERVAFSGLGPTSRRSESEGPPRSPQVGLSLYDGRRSARLIADSAPSPRTGRGRARRNRAALRHDLERPRAALLFRAAAGSGNGARSHGLALARRASFRAGRGTGGGRRCGGSFLRSGRGRLSRLADRRELPWNHPRGSCKLRRQENERDGRRPPKRSRALRSGPPRPRLFRLSKRRYSERRGRNDGGERHQRSAPNRLRGVLPKSRGSRKAHRTIRGVEDAGSLVRTRGSSLPILAGRLFQRAGRARRRLQPTAGFGGPLPRPHRRRRDAARSGPEPGSRSDRALSLGRPAAQRPRLGAPRKRPDRRRPPPARRGGREPSGTRQKDKEPQRRDDFRKSELDSAGPRGGRAAPGRNRGLEPDDRPEQTKRSIQGPVCPFSTGAGPLARGEQDDVERAGRRAREGTLGPRQRFIRRVPGLARKHRGLHLEPHSAHELRLPERRHPRKDAPPPRTRA